MKTLIERSLESRRIIFQAAIVATLIGFGINLISSWFAEIFKNRILVILAAGVLLVILGLIYFVWHLLADRQQHMDLNGVIVFDDTTKRITEIDNYYFSERLDNALTGAFLENEALKNAWEQQMFPSASKNEDKNQEEKTDENIDDVQYYSIIKIEKDESSLDIASRAETSRVLLEAVEFCLLENMSMHLAEYFDSANHDRSKMQIIERDNIPRMVLSNRILSLLTTPIEDRQIFLKSGISKNPPEGEIHAIFGTNGARYERFSLILPLGTKIIRPSLGHIVLEHPRFHIELLAQYDRFNEVLPRYFPTFYMGLKNSQPKAHKIKIKVLAKLHPSALLHLNGWEYYKWIDSFFDYLRERISFDDFLKRINWNSVEAQIRSNIILDKNRSS